MNTRSAAAPFMSRATSASLVASPTSRTCCPSRHRSPATLMGASRTSGTASSSVSPEELLNTLPLLKGATGRQKTPNTLTAVVHRAGPVKLSFFGLSLRRVGEPELTDDGVARVATLRDVGGCKMAVIQSRSEAKDYLDIHALLRQGLEVAEMLGAAQAIYGEQFFPMITLKALAWFKDGDLPGLPAEVKEALSRAAGDVRQIPNLKPLAGGVSPAAA